MRHFFVARPVTTLSRGMAASPCRTILVALAGALLRAAPDPLGTAFGKTNLAAVAAAADQHPASDSPRKETAAPISRRYGRNRDRHMDDHRDCRDTAPACVPSTCGARRRCGTAKFEIGAVPAPRKQQTPTRHPGWQSARRRPAEQHHQLSIGSPFEAPLLARANDGKRPARHPAPDRRRFRPPSTIHL
jgi:hypothetical protein